MQLREALYIDLVALIASACLLARYPGIRFTHPGTVYWVFHALIITLRFWLVDSGAEPFLDVPLASMTNFLLIADAFLVAATIGWISVTPSPAQQPARLDESKEDSDYLSRIVLQVGAIAGPIGLVALFSSSYVPGSDTVSGNITSYNVVPVLWPILLVLAWIYARGFNLIPVSLFIVLLGVLAIQGHSRYRFVIPLVIMLTIFLDRKVLRWPPKWAVAIAIIAGITFVPLKELGSAAQRGELSLASYIATLEETANELVSGENSEHALADQGAIVVMLSEGRELLLGKPYVALLTLPVPRAIWPEKPGLADHLAEIQTKSFPVGRIGAITTLPGDFWLNFGLPGVLIGGWAFGRVTGRWTNVAYASPRVSASRFGHVLLIAVMVQVARDGIMSLVVFAVTSCLPWLVIALLLRNRPGNSPAGLSIERQYK